VVHFDLKCDNILLDSLETPRDPAALPFRVVLSDFGESRMYQSASSALTVRYEGLGPLKYIAYTRNGAVNGDEPHGTSIWLDFKNQSACISASMALYVAWQ